MGWGGGGVLQNPCTLPSFIGEKVSGRGTGGGGVQKNPPALSCDLEKRE